MDPKKHMIAQALYDDPLYGLNNVTNARKWGAAFGEQGRGAEEGSERDERRAHHRLAFEAELGSYFGLDEGVLDTVRVAWPSE